MLAVGELDEHDAQVARHRHQHFAEILGLRFLVGSELHLVELGETIDELGNFLAELIGQLALAGPGIFQHIVQQRRHHGIGVHAPFDDGAGHRQRMRNVGFAGHALLMRMRLGREGISLLDLRYFFGRKIVETIEKNPVGGFFHGRRW